MPVWQSGQNAIMLAPDKLAAYVDTPREVALDATQAYDASAIMRNLICPLAVANLASSESVRAPLALGEHFRPFGGIIRHFSLVEGTLP